MGQQIDPKANLPDAALRKMPDEITPDLIVNVVDEILVVRGASLQDHGRAVQQLPDNIKKESKIETEEQFQAALKQENMTLADLRKNEKTAIVSRVQQNEVLGR